MNRKCIVEECLGAGVYRIARHGDLVDCEIDGVKYGARIVVSVGSKFMAYDRDGKLQSDEVQELYDWGSYKFIKNVFEE